MRRFAVFLTCALLAASPARAATATEIVVTGVGTVALMPDVASVNATITTTAPTASDAVAANNSRYDSAVAAAERTGVNRNDITLAFYNVNFVPKPPHPLDGSSQQTYGYTVTRTFDVKVRTMSKAGTVVDAITSVEGATIGGVGFGLADSRKAQSEATAHAVTDARAQGEALAAAAGMHIVGIKQIVQGGGPPIVQPIMRATAMALPAPTTFDASNVNVRAEVTMTFLAQP